MAKAGIVVDAWKFDIFEAALKAAGYTYNSHPGPGSKLHTFTVNVTDLQPLADVVKAANEECARAKRNSH